MDELSARRLAFALTVVAALGGCTIRERVAYEDCVRSRCTSSSLSCERVGAAPDAGVSGVRICTTECEDDADCPDDPLTERAGRCVALHEGLRCLPSCEGEFDCSAPLECDPGEGLCVPAPL